MKMFSTIVLAVPLVAVTPAFGQGTEAQRAACGPDAFRLCTSAIPDPGRVAACLRRERERLSGACRAMLDEADGASRTAAAPPPPDREAAPQPARTARIRTERRIVAAPPPPAPAPAARAPRRANLAASAPATRTLVSRRGATRTVTRVVYVYVPTKAAPARHAAPRRVASRGGYGSYGGGSQMAQAMYWMRTVSSYAGAMGVDAGSLGGMNLGGLAGLMQ